MKLLLTIGMAALLLLPATSAFAEGAGIEWDILSQEAVSLYQNGQYDRAATVAKKALEVAEKGVGPDHPDVATSLNNLALPYASRGQYEQAEPLYLRSLAIWEKTLGPDDPSVAASLNNLAMLYVSQGQYDKAEPLYQRSLAIRESWKNSLPSVTICCIYK